MPQALAEVQRRALVESGVRRGKVQREKVRQEKVRQEKVRREKVLRRRGGVRVVARNEVGVGVLLERVPLKSVAQQERVPQRNEVPRRKEGRVRRKLLLTLPTRK